jgi:hypothetical protein
VNKFPSKSIILTASLVLSSCSATQPLHPLQPLTALLAHPSAKSRLLLESAVGDLFNSKPIKLADNVFLDKNIVIIEHSQPNDSRGNLLDGRELREADIASLVIFNGECYVRHNKSGYIKLVPNISCKEQ